MGPSAWRALLALLLAATSPALGDGACIVGGSSCQVTTDVGCAGLGGTFVGEGSSCASDVGACCLPDGSCLLATAATCAGTFAGGGTACATVTCPQPGACCFPTGDCVQTELVGGGFDVGGTCAELGGTYRGDDTDCGLLTCPAPGACCLPDGACVIAAAAGGEDCLAKGGAYLGDDTVCAAASCQEPGWNWIDNLIMLTKNEPAWWAASSGQPKGVSPFTTLDPDAGEGPGRIDPESTGDRVLRGYVVAWAVDGDDHEIRWNHLSGGATVVDYRNGTAWEHNAWSFPVVAAVSNGEATGTPGILELDGVEYAPPFDQLVLDFRAVGNTVFSNGATVGIDTDLTLVPVGVDLRQDTSGPAVTKVVYSIWNQNEVKFSGLDRCIACWDELRLGLHRAPNHFLQVNLQTDAGRARLDGIASSRCGVDVDPTDGKALGDDSRDLLSRDAALLGVAAKLIQFETRTTLCGDAVHGMGTQAATIRHDLLAPPPEAHGEPVLSDIQNETVLSATPPVSARPQPTDTGSAAVVGADRVSATAKGSLLLFPKIELRWDRSGTLVQDTIVWLSNDFPEDVRIQMYFVNGDPPLGR